MGRFNAQGVAEFKKLAMRLQTARAQQQPHGDGLTLQIGLITSVRRHRLGHVFDADESWHAGRLRKHGMGADRHLANGFRPVGLHQPID